MKKLFFGLLLSSAALLSACSNSSDNATKDTNKGDNDDLHVVTTFYPMYDFTKNVVGDEGEVSILLPAGMDMHDFEPSAKDIAMIQEADVFVYNNENMESWVPSIEQTLDEGNVNVIKASGDMDLIAGSEEHDHEAEHHDADDHHHEFDPHIWLSPARAITEVENIRDELIAAYPDKKAAFTTNAETYLAQLKDLDQTFKDSLNNAKVKNFVAQHAAFGYLAHDYGLTQVPIAGLSPNEEPSPARLAEIKDFVSKNNVKYIYFEESAKDTIAKTLADEAGVSLEVMNTLEGLTQEEIDNGENYISIMQDNLKTLEKTTNGTAE